MLSVSQNDQSILIYSQDDLDSYIRTAGDPRLDPESVCLDLGLGLFCRANLTRRELYQFMGYKTFDFAFPQPWADKEGQALFVKYGWQPGDRYPALVWCYDPKDGSDRGSLFGYPVFDKDVIKNMGRLIRKLILNQDPAIRHIENPWKDPDFDADLVSETV